MFTFNMPVMEKPFTRRGVLSTLNSLYDPLGFAAPVTIQDKSILRELTDRNSEWDSSLPKEVYEPWSAWRDSLKALNEVLVPRVLTAISPSTAVRKELHIFSDASTKTIAAVAYLRTTGYEGNIQTGLIMGKAKLAPRPECSIPRLELCATVLVVELGELISSEIDIQFHATDSKVVQGYICNETRRFYVYVSNHILRIRKFSHLEQWRHVSIDQNPADLGTQSVPASHLKRSSWLHGLRFLSFENEICQRVIDYSLVEPDSDIEIRPQVSTLITFSTRKQLGSLRF